MQRQIKAQFLNGFIADFRGVGHLKLDQGTDTAFIINDTNGATIAASSTKDKDIKAQAGTKSDKSKLVGAAIARKAVDLGVKEVVFDRGGYLYHGRVKSVADGAREGGLQF